MEWRSFAVHAQDKGIDKNDALVGRLDTIGKLVTRVHTLHWDGTAGFDARQN
jgi:hypothetical protein